MQAALFHSGEIEYRTDYAMPKAEADEARIRLHLAGICGTDLEIVQGYAGFEGVLGHEFVGSVEEARQERWVGQRVVGSINLGCGECETCLRHGSEHCPNRRVLGIRGKDGAFADYLTLPTGNLFSVPDSVADEEALFTEPLAAALRIREQIRARPTARSAVVGPGRLGMLVGQVLALDGGDVTMIGRRMESLELPQRLDLETALPPDVADGSFDVVVECTGNEAGLAQALRLLRPRGTLVIKSTFHGSTDVDVSRLVVDEIKVLGSRCGPFAPALRLLHRGGVDVTALIDGEFPLSRIDEAMRLAAQPGVRKILLRP